MRGAAGVVLFGVTVLAAAGLAAGAVLANIPDDPDAPIATANYGQETLLAEAAQATRPEQPSPARRIEVAAYEVTETLRTVPRGLKVAFLPPEAAEDPWLPIEAQPGQSLSFAPAPPARIQKLNAKEILLRISPKATDARKGRWFVFAAGSGEAFGLNLVRDGERGLRRAGWSVERLAEYGKAQVGVGWRKGSRQISLSAARREISAYGLTQEDTVAGVTVSVKP